MSHKEEVYALRLSQTELSSQERRTLIRAVAKLVKHPFTDANDPFVAELVEGIMPHQWSTLYCVRGFDSFRGMLIAQGLTRLDIAWLPKQTVAPGMLEKLSLDDFLEVPIICVGTFGKHAMTFIMNRLNRRRDVPQQFVVRDLLGIDGLLVNYIPNRMAAEQLRKAFSDIVQGLRIRGCTDSVPLMRVPTTLSSRLYIQDVPGTDTVPCSLAIELEKPREEE